MGSHTIAAGHVAKHGVTLTASTVETFTFTDNIGVVEVMSDGAADVFYTVDGSTPTIAGPNTYRLPAGGFTVDTRALAPGHPDQLRAISAGTPTLSVQAG